MNLDAAMAQATKDAESYKDGKGETKCPKDRSGLIVVVYGDEKGEAMSGVKVKAGDKSATTGDDGIAKYLPIDQGQHKVHVEKPSDKDLLLAPDDVTVQVRKASCGVCPVEIPVGSRPELEFVWAHDAKKVKDVEVKLKKGADVKYTFAKKSGDDGVTKWDEKDKEPILPGAYSLELALPKGAKVDVLDKDDNPVADPVHIAKGRPKLSFKLRKRAKIAVEITDLPAWFTPGKSITIKYKLDGDEACAEKTDVEVHVASRFEKGQVESTYYTASKDRDGNPVDKPSGTETESDLTQTHLLRDHKDGVKPGEATFPWDGSCKAKAGVLKDPAKINSSCAPYTVLARYYKDDADKKAKLTLKPFYPRWTVQKGGTYKLDEESLVVEWKIDGDDTKKLKIGELRVVDKDGKKVFESPLDEGQIAGGKYELLKDAKKKWDAAAVKRESMPYRVQVRAGSDENEPNGLALAAMPTMVRAYEYTKVQLIAFNVGPASSYTGDVNDDTDITKRCDVMKAAVKAAFGKAKKEPGVLKVFMAPEFYFRGPAGAYPVGKLGEIVPKLREETDKIEYVDWLFVFGTAIGYQKHEDAGEALTYGEAPHRVVIETTDSTTEITAKVWTRPQAGWAFRQGKWTSEITSATEVAEVDDGWRYKIALTTTTGLSRAEEAEMVEPMARILDLDVDPKTGRAARLHIKSKVCTRIPTTSVGGQYWRVKQGNVIGRIVGVSAGITDVHWIKLEQPGNFTKDKPVVFIEPKATEVFNVAQVQKGWPAPHMGHGSLVHAAVYKENVSPIDFDRNKKLDWHAPDGSNRRITIHSSKDRPTLPTEGSADLGGSHQNVRLPGSAVGSEINKSGIGGGTVVTFDGVTFGIEVCLDHAENRLHLFYNGSSKKSEAGDPTVQIHLIPSWGMSIGGGQIVCSPSKGLVFNVDGARCDSVVRIHDGKFSCDDHWGETATKNDPCPKVVDYYYCGTCGILDTKAGPCPKGHAKAKFSKCGGPKEYFLCGEKGCGLMEMRCGHGVKCKPVHLCQRCRDVWEVTKSPTCKCPKPAPVPCGDYVHVSKSTCSMGHSDKKCNKLMQRLGTSIDPDGDAADVPGSDDTKYFEKKGTVLAYPEKELAPPDVV